MIKSFDGKDPKISESAFISRTALIIGDVHIGDESGIWPGVVIGADFAPVRIGRLTIIEDNCVVHCGSLMEIGDNVIVGHSVVLHGKKIGNNTLIGSNSTILDNSEIGDYCVISAGSVVSPGMKIPDRSFVVGIPGKIQKEIKAGVMKRLVAGNKSYLPFFEKYKAAGV
ncbi:MAG: gamma carbonic anhydrase family protein [Deltaproteobacteria bacterium]|nr:gamma carbonic anhydrase family protein [Deltaproteobacteria bacterium]